MNESSDRSSTYTTPMRRGRWTSKKWSNCASSMGLFEESYDQFDRIRALVREFDADGSGEIEFSEFNAMVAKARDILK